MKKLFERYAEFLVENEIIVLIISALIIGAAAYSSFNVRLTAPEYSDMIPQDMESIEALDYISEEFGISGETANVLVEVEPEYAGSSEPRDVRDYEVVRYINILHQNLEDVENVNSVTSIASQVSKNGRIPFRKTEIIERLQDSGKEVPDSVNPVSIVSTSVRNLRDIESSLEKQSRSLEDVGSGVENASHGLEDIDSSLEKIIDAVGKMKVSGDVSDLLDLIDQTEYMVENSGASLSEKQDILENLAILREGVKALGSNIDELGNSAGKVEGSLEEVSEGVSETNQGLEQVLEGIYGLENGSSQLSGGVGKVASGLSATESYMRLYEGGGLEPLRGSEESGSELVSDDYSMTVMRLSVTEMTQSEKEEFAREVKKVFEVTEKPSYVEVSGSGDAFVFNELMEETGPTLSRTSRLSTFLVFTLIITFFASIRYGVTAFLTIVFGELITLGLLAFLGVPISSEMSGAVSMIMAIGDDFGIQVTNRFKQELRDRKIRDAMVKTLSNVMLPMSITTLSILIGFRAFMFGRLQFLTTLGNMLSVGVVSCFIASVTIIPVILVIGERKLGGNE